MSDKLQSVVVAILIQVGGSRTFDKLKFVEHFGVRRQSEATTALWIP